MKIYICGDSISAEYSPEQSPQAGWGQMLEKFLPNISVVNKAIGGRSTKSFLSEGRLSEIEPDIEAGDILLIQFAHNDENPIKWRYCEPYNAYLNNLGIFAETARFYGAVPVILSPICMRVWKNGVLSHTHGDYPAAAKSAAIKYSAEFIDMYSYSHALVQSLGEEGSKRLFLHIDGKAPDDAHTSVAGAEAFAQIIARELMSRGIAGGGEER